MNGGGGPDGPGPEEPRLDPPGFGGPEMTHITKLSTRTENSHALTLQDNEIQGQCQDHDQECLPGCQRLKIHASMQATDTVIKLLKKYVLWNEVWYMCPTVELYLLCLTLVS